MATSSRIEITRVLYASGPGNIIGSHHFWRRGEHDPTEVSITFSSQVEEFCKQGNISCHLISTHAKRQTVRDGNFVLEHRPKRSAKGAMYHVVQVLYGLGLLRTALRFRAQVALIDSGVTDYFVLLLFRAFGIKVVSVLHNTLWPKNFPPKGGLARVLLWLDTRFWMRGPLSVIAVSPECERQVRQLCGSLRYPVFQIRAQFDVAYFSKIPPAPPHGRPFQIMFIGRIIRLKGVFDILEIARKIESHDPGLIKWVVCGTGVDFEELKARHGELELDGVVDLRGWTSLDDLAGIYAASHACIVPTTSAFTEGLAMTAAEAILAGRPLITNPVVPALEVLRAACLKAETDDAESHMQAVLKLATDARLYEELRAACAVYQQEFYDRRFGLTEILKSALAPGGPTRDSAREPESPQGH